MPTPEVRHFCPGCMSETQAAPCPYCGFDERIYRPAPQHLPPQTLLNGKYIVGRVLREDAASILYLGWDLLLACKVCLKEYYPTGLSARGPDQTVSPFAGQSAAAFLEGREQFLSQARSLARFSSLPDIWKVTDFFLENGTACMVAEPAEGATLAEQVRLDGPIPAGQALRLFEPLMRSLAEMHAAGVVHQGISPENILLTPARTLKLLDFSTGKAGSTLMVQPGYSPEEQYRAQGQPTPSTDVYALSATLYFVLTGKTPPESLERLVEDTLARPGAYAPLTQQQEQALLWGLAPLQRDRPQTMEALRVALLPDSAAAAPPISVQAPAAPVQQTVPVVPPTSYASSVQKPPPPPDTEPHKPKGFSRLLRENRTLFLAGGVCLGVVILVVTLVALLAGGPKTDPGSTAVDSAFLSLDRSDASVSDGVGSESSQSNEAVSLPYIEYDLSLASQMGVWESQRNDEVYLLADGSGSPLLSMPVGGGDIRTVVSDPVLSYLVTDDWVYYLNQADRCIYRLDRDGSLSAWDCLSKPLASDSNAFTYYNGYLYYLMDGKDEQGNATVELSYCDIEADQRYATSLHGAVLRPPLGYDGWLYFLFEDGTGATQLYRCKPDGTEFTVRCSFTEWCTDLFLLDGDLFVQTWNTDDWTASVYRLKPEQGELALLFTDALFGCGVPETGNAYGKLFYSYITQDIQIRSARYYDLAAGEIRVLDDTAGLWCIPGDENGFGDLYSLSADGTALTRRPLSGGEGVPFAALEQPATELNAGAQHIYCRTDSSLLCLRADTGELVQQSAVRGYAGSTTPGNLNNHGKYAAADGWTYACRYDQIVRFTEEERSPETVVDDIGTPFYLNVADGWAYYNDYDAKTINRVRLDGSDGQVLLDEDCYWIQVRGEWVYYISSGSHDLRRMRTDGRENTLLVENASAPNLVGDWIYCTASGKMQRMRTDGSGRTPLYDLASSMMEVAGGWIYYLDSDRLLCRIAADGSGGQERLTDQPLDSSNGFCIAGGWIVFVRDADDTVWHCRLDGADAAQLSDGPLEMYIRSAGDWVYYDTEDGLRRVRADGASGPEDCAWLRG